MVVLVVHAKAPSTKSKRPRFVSFSLAFGAFAFRESLFLRLQPAGARLAMPPLSADGLCIHVFSGWRSVADSVACFWPSGVARKRARFPFGAADGVHVHGFVVADCLAGMLPLFFLCR